MLSAQDRTEILDLYARYIQTLNHCEAEGWANCFTEDGVFLRPKGSDVAGVQAVRVTGRPALAKLCRDAFEEGQRRRRRWCANIELKDGEHDGEATGRASFMLLHASGPGPASLAVTGMFHDRLRRTPEGWRLAERTLALET